MFYIKFGTTEAEEQCIKYKKQNDSHHEDPIKRNVKSTWMDRVFLKRPTSNLISFVSTFRTVEYPFLFGRHHVKTRTFQSCSFSSLVSPFLVWYPYKHSNMYMSSSFYRTRDFMKWLGIS